MNMIFNVDFEKIKIVVFIYRCVKSYMKCFNIQYLFMCNLYFKLLLYTRTLGFTQGWIY
jgi:hypothetical protein